jgi:cytochrome-b5 reductase
MDATVTVVDVGTVGPRTVAITFESPPEFVAEPGQFVKLSATVEGEEYSRFYTLSSPDTDGDFEVTVGIDPEEAGPFSRYLESLASGDELEMSGPFGSDFYEGEARAVCIVGGPGIGPAVGIAEAAVDAGNEAAIVYRSADPSHRGRLDDLATRGVDVRIVEDDPTDAGGDLTDDGGDLTDAVAGVLTGSDGEQVFVYGFADFLDDALAAIEAADADPEAAKVENFG